MNLADRITIDPEICHGKPTIRGLRYPVETILELLSSGMTNEELLAEYEDLEPADILAAMDFASRCGVKSHSAEGTQVHTVVRPLWEIAEEISSQVPLEEWEKLPTDGAEQHDHYLYGSPKRDNG
jgi:uncharacterized protein (DUF433 family)